MAAYRQQRWSSGEAGAIRSAMTGPWTRTIDILPVGGFIVALLALALPLPTLMIGLVLAVMIVAAVHHAEVIAHRVGEPFGTFILALAVTVIEVGLILSLMQAKPEATLALARDTVFAAVMVILNLIIGLCLLVGALRHHEQTFKRTGNRSALSTLTVLTVVTLVLPNFTSSAPGPRYSDVQLGFVALVSLILYLTFVLVQTVRHRDYFLPVGNDEHVPHVHADPPSNRRAVTSMLLLVACLVAVVVLAKTLSPAIGAGLAYLGAPVAVLGILIAALVLAPEGLAAVRAAGANRLQTSFNLALGSALATIGLTIPAVALMSILGGMPIMLGLDPKAMILLFLSLMVASHTLANGRTTVLQGTIHLTLFAVYLFTTFVP